MRRWLDPDERYGLRVTLLAVAVVLVAVPFALLTLQVVRDGPLTEVDRAVTNAARGWLRDRPDAVGRAVRLVSDLGKPVFLTVLAGAVAMFVLYRDRVRLAVFVVTTSLLGGFVNSGVKVLVARPRPDSAEALVAASGNSFPSGHAMGSTVVYGALLLALLPLVPRPRRRYAVAATAALVLAVAASRVLLGVHYLSDVLAGLVLGLAWLAASVAAFRAWRTESGAPRGPVLDGADPGVAD